MVSKKVLQKGAKNKNKIIIFKYIFVYTFIK